MGATLQSFLQGNPSYPNLEPLVITACNCVHSSISQTADSIDSSHWCTEFQRFISVLIVPDELQSLTPKGGFYQVQVGLGTASFFIFYTQSDELPPVFDFLQHGFNDKDRSVRVNAGCIGGNGAMCHNVPCARSVEGDVPSLSDLSQSNLLGITPDITAVKCWAQIASLPQSYLHADVYTSLRNFCFLEPLSVVHKVFPRNLIFDGNMIWELGGGWQLELVS
ncbi:hypothetical protein BDR06DRAFT_966973 [Suillus hirtellus]|nr:hypothetical protein BDR06DRAFT_966973 [Suillus hirtellus]